VWKDLAMARTRSIPLVDRIFLAQSESAADAILVGSPAWYAWLTNATSFAFRSDYGTFTAHKERRGHAREYWKAYRRRAGRLYRAYLGKSVELTLERLNAVAADLARGVADAISTTTFGASPGITHDVVEVAEDARKRHTASVAQHSTLDQPVHVPVHYTSTPALVADDARPLHLLATKLAIPPSRANLVPRQRLVEQLDVAIRQGRKLILISAPAGFGKTTAVVEWLSTKAEGRRMKDEVTQQSLHPSSLFLHPFQVAWLALDDQDNHLGQFLAYLIAALETLRPGIGADAWALLRTLAEQPPTQAILTVLVNALADSDDQVVLVLDDYHAINLQAIHEAVAFLLDRMPTQMHVVMTSRADPPLPLARLRVRGSLTEVRAADLRFTPDEATALFDRFPGIHLPSDAVTALESRTEGWIAGLQLAVLSLQQQDAAQIPAFLADFTGSHRYVFDYLADEVFQRQPDAVRTFLMQTAILARLCGPLCDAVMGQESGQAMLEYLDQANLFLIRLDSRRHWYRYHHLFQDFLHERMERAIDRVGLALLHRRASAWFEQHHLLGEAVDHALSAQAWGDAVRWLSPIMGDEQFYDYYLDWPRWLAALPDAVLQANPELCLRLARILILIGHIEAAERPLRLAEMPWQAAGNQPKLGELLGYRALALVFKRDFSHAMQLAQQALAKLPEDAIEQRGVSSYVLGYSTLSLGHVGLAADLLSATHVAFQSSSDRLLLLAAAVGVTRASQFQGQLQLAAALYHDVIRRAGDATHQQQPAVYFFLGRLYYEWNDLASAERALHEGIAVGQRTGRGRYWPSAYAALAWVRWARGDTAQTTFMLDQALASARLLDSPPHIVEAETRQAGLWLAQGDLAAAVGWLATRALNVDDEVSYQRLPEYLLFARIRIAQEQQTPGSVDLDTIVSMLDRLCKAAQADERMYDKITILALTALAYAAQPDPDQALVSLAKALALAEPEGYIRTFVDEGAPMRSLLMAQRAHLPASEMNARLLAYIDRLLKAFPQDVPAGPPESTIFQLLSERERAVLQLIADGRSVQEIATLLVISAHTARTHIKNIYAKLDAHNRIQAVERARALDLL
jgi:ATP/maltotriose-dependent transcriptional regulator MalT